MEVRMDTEGRRVRQSQHDVFRIQRWLPTYRGVAGEKEAAGGGAGRRGHGVMEVRTVSGPDWRGGTRTAGSERGPIVPIRPKAVDRPKDSIRSGTKVPPIARSR